MRDINSIADMSVYLTKQTMHLQDEIVKRQQNATNFLNTLSSAINQMAPPVANDGAANASETSRIDNAVVQDAGAASIKSSPPPVSANQDLIAALMQANAPAPGVSTTKESVLVAASNASPTLTPPPSSPTQAAPAIPVNEQNCIDSTRRSNYIYTSNKNAIPNTLWQLEDGLRRAVDTYDATVSNMDPTHYAGLSARGQPMYVTRDRAIAMAQDTIDFTKANFEKHKAFVNDPTRRAQEVGYQIINGKSSLTGPELSLQDQILVRELRALNLIVDASAARVTT